jgi:hypothetical protein
LLIYGQPRPQVEHLLPPPEQPMARPTPPPAAPHLSPPQAPAAVAALPAPAASASTQHAGPEAPVAASQPGPDLIAQRIEQIEAANLPKSPAVRTSSARAGGLRLQLGAVRSESQARGEWQRLKHQNPDLLGNMSAVAVRADLGDKGVYYRIQAGPVADPSTADRVCGALRQRHLTCMIVR